MPGDHDHEQHQPEQQRNVAAIEDLEQVGAEEGEVDGQEQAGDRAGAEPAPTPAVTHDVVEQDRGQQHGGRDRGAESAGQLCRAAEADGDGDGRDHHDPVHQRHVDLAIFLVGGLADHQARHPAELHRLAGEGIGAGDDRLAGDDGGHRGQRHQRVDSPVRHLGEERVVGQLRVAQDLRRLAGIVQQQPRQHDAGPGEAHRAAAEMAHVGIQRLAAGQRQKHAAEHDEAAPAVMDQESRAVERADGGEHAGEAGDGDGADRADHREPDQHDRAEQFAQPCGAERLGDEQADQDGDRQRQHVGFEGIGGDIQALDRAQHGDGGGDDAVAVDQRGAKQAGRDQQAAAMQQAGLAGRPEQRHQRQNAALALVVGTHHHQAVLDGDGDDQRPDDQRQAAERHLRADLAAGIADHGLEGVERAGAEIAVDDAQRAQAG